ncbi:hypothetical protein SDC9_91348 [bioreactor metagenome]|uniref:STAS domain-containing protein n=1 Tax=bioreactor metagenome TaxID=1076179 RepID=A0A644ZUI9_9ZZZZ
MKFSYKSFPIYTVITLEGQYIGGDETDQLSLFTRELINKDVINIIIDMEATTYINSIMIGFLVKINNELLSKSGKLILCNVSKVIMEVFEITKVSDLIQICSDCEQAVDAITS